MRKIFRMAIVCVIAGAALLAGCTKDYGAAVKELQDNYGELSGKVTTLEGSVKSLQDLINKGFVITDVVSNADGFLVKFSNNTEKQVYNGKPGEAGHSPEITIKDGVWYVDGKSTGVKAEGKDGKNGETPTVEIKDGEWVINGKATGVKAKGEDGHSPVITIVTGSDGELYWAIDGVQTTYKAQGPKGDKGTDGKDGKDANPWEYDPATGEFVQKDAKTGEELQRKSAFPNGERPLTAVWDTVNNQLVFSNVKSGDDYISYSIELTPVLSSIVAVPDLYYGGIEAFKYNYMNYITNLLMAKEDEHGFQDDDDSWAYITDLNKADSLRMYNGYIGSIAEVKYWINPAAYDAEKNASFEIEGRDYNYMDVPTKTALGVDWNPNIYKQNYENGVKRVKDNLYKVQFTIDDPDELQPQTMNTAGATAKSDVSVVRLSGFDMNYQNELDAAKEVSSDYAALVPMEQGLAALAFNISPMQRDYDEDGASETWFDSDVLCTKLVDEYGNPVVNDFYHLYSSARLAIEGNGIPWAWDGGDRKIDFVNIHLYDADTTQPRTVDNTKAVAMSIDDFLAKYPGFRIQYDLVEYRLGDANVTPDDANITPEDWFGKIEKKGDDWFFTPYYGDKPTNTKIPAKESDKGISAVGRRPLVLARLYDPDGKIALVGYFKFQIVKKYEQPPVQETTCKGTVVRDFSDKMLAYSCDRDSLWTDWLDMSSTILEDYFGIDYRQFRNEYQIYYQNGATTGTANADFVGYVLDTYDLKSGKTGNTLSDYQISKTGAAFKYGTITYKPDSSGDVTGGGVNDVFYIYVDKAQKDAIKAAGGSKTLYFKVQKKGTLEYFMLGFTIKLAPEGAVQFVEHIPTYWFNDIEKSKVNTVRRNVQVPTYYMDPSHPDYDATQTNSDVTEFVKPLTHDWVGNKVKVQGSNADLVVDWTFDTTQPFTWKNTKFKVNNNTGTDELLLTFDDPEVAGVQNDTVVVLNRTTGELRYYWNSDPDYISKKLLNLYAPKETDPAKMLYCKIKLSAKSVKRDAQGQIICEIPLGSEAIYARFLRPLTLKISDNAYLRDGVATADYFEIGTFIEEARDWNAAESTDGLGYKIFEKDANGNFVTCYKNNAYGVPQVDWYRYYGFENIVIDLSKIKTDQRNPGQEPKGLISEINPAAIIFIAKKATPQKVEYAANQVATIPIDDVAQLGEWVFSYENHQGVTESFHLFVPVSIEYKWGKVTQEIAVPVRATKTSQGN